MFYIHKDSSNLNDKLKIYISKISDFDQQQEEKSFQNLIGGKGDKGSKELYEVKC